MIAHEREWEARAAERMLCGEAADAAADPAAKDGSRSADEMRPEGCGRPCADMWRDGDNAMDSVWPRIGLAIAAFDCGLAGGT